VAGERGLHRDLRGLEIADLADHVTSGLAHDRAQRVGERQVDLRLLDLVDADHLVLDGVSTVRIFTSGLVQAIERGVERGGLAEPVGQ
jgi:hypothetical protein